MLDEIFELFERDKKKRNGRPAGKRSLLDRMSGMLGDDDRNERHRDDDEDRERARYDDDRHRDSEHRKPSKKRRLADLLEFD